MPGAFRSGKLLIGTWVSMVDRRRMRNSDPENADIFPSAMGVMTRLAYESARQEGLGVDLLLERADLTREQMDDPDTRLSVKSQVKFLDLVAVALNDDCLGFHIAQKYDFRIIGLPYYVMASSDMLHEALRRGARYCAIVNDAIALRFREEEDIGIGFEYLGIPRHPDRHQIEFAMVSLVRICRHLANRQLSARRVSFEHQRYNDISEFKAFFGGEVMFGASEDDLAFSTSIKEMAVVSADPYLNRLLIKYCDQALADRAKKRSSFGVEKAIAILLPHGEARAEAVARKLGVSKQRLARRLSSEDLTFNKVLRDVRYDLAKRHLADETLSVSEIAWLLGYSDIRAFAHAFIGSKALEATLDALTAGVFLIDRHHRVIYMNRSADRQVSASDTIRIHKDQLIPLNEEARAAMRKGLDQVIASGPGMSSAVTLALPSSDGPGLVATILPLDHDRASSSSPFAATAAIFVQDSIVPQFRGEAFAKLYGLTDGELRVVLAMVPGLGAREVAEMLGISEATAKTHLQHVYAKTGTSKQTELMHLFMASTPPVQE